MEMLKKIVLVLNKPERETRTLEKIRSTIKQINPHTEVYILVFDEPEFIPKVLEIAPSVIMTFPLTCQSLPQRFYILKYLLNCRLVCYRAEGLLPSESQKHISSIAGIGKYGANLVDYEIFWGPKPAELIGKALLEQRKISSGDRIRFLGWPFLEDYFEPDSEFEKILPDKIKGKLNQYPREKILLFVTGFSVGDYSPDDIINADDIVDTSKPTAQKVFEESRALFKKIKHFQQMWIKEIIRNAENLPSLLFIVKMHPHEIAHYRRKKFNPYSVFHNYNNILLIEEAIPFRAIISHCSILFHYGSTTMLESYLSKIPSVHIFAREFKEICKDLSSSTISVEINDIASVISQHVVSPLKLKQSHEVEKYLEDMADLKIGQDYRPSERIARFLLSLFDEHPQVIAADDKYLVHAYEQNGGHNLINARISKAVKSINDGDFQRALTIYLDNVMKLAKIAKTQVLNLHFLRSICLYKTGFIDQAIAAVNQELTFNPQNEQANNLRSQLHSLSRKTEGIKTNQSEDFEKMIPKTFQVETVAGCNLKCPECAVGADIITHRKKGFMSFDEFKVIADKIRPFCEYLYLHIWGEPLLNKDIFKIIQYASAFTKTNISTNGNCLTEVKAEKLILSGITDIIVSIDGVSQDVYEKYRKGGSVTRALWSLVKLQELNIKYSKNVNIYPQFLVFKHNQHEMDKFTEFCQSIGLNPTFKSPYIRSNSMFENSDNSEYVRPSYQDVASLKHAMSEKCNNPRAVFTVLLDGGCVICCLDHDGATNYGNIYQQDVLDIWNSPEYRKDRLDILMEDAPEFCLKNCLNWSLCDTSIRSSKNLETDIVRSSSHKAGTSASVDSDSSLANVKDFAIHGNNYGSPHNTILSDFQKGLEYARKNIHDGKFNEAFDIYEQLYIAYPKKATEILAEAYDKYQIISNHDRYVLYQSRYYNFNINPNDKVLDIGSGNMPLQLATHLADITTDNNTYGRAGVPFKYVDGKPVFECNIEELPFEDKEFDFVYCSHVLEHIINPKKACDELIRIAKRGYIETPTRAKDLWLNTTEISNHKWAVELENDILVFNEYKAEEIKGLGCNILLEMHYAPQTIREKAFSALIYLKPKLFNTMLLWKDSFEYRIRRVTRQQETKSPVTFRKSIAISNKTQQDTKCVHNENSLRVRRGTKSIKSKCFPNIIMPVKINNRSKIQIIGTEYGSSAIVLDLIPAGSTVISAGVGEDISFDLELIKLKQCRIIGIDPTEKAKRYIKNNPNEHFCFLQKALYAESNKKIKMYKNTNPSYVSESITDSHNMVSKSEFYETEVISISELLEEYKDISLLKIDIEGAEYEVINSLEELYVPQIYIEFHHFCTDFTPYDTTRCIAHLNDMGYVVVYGKSLQGALKDVTLVHRKYVCEEDIFQIRADKLGEADLATSGVLATNIV